MVTMPPKVTMAISARLLASESAASVSLSVTKAFVQFGYGLSRHRAGRVEQQYAGDAGLGIVGEFARLEAGILDLVAHGLAPGLGLPQLQDK